MPGTPGSIARQGRARLGPQHVESRTPTPGGRSPTLFRATVGLVVLGLIWRTVRYALAFPLWGDEAFVAVNLLTRGLRGLADPLEFFQIVPPGFLWVEWLAVHALGPNEWALRLVPYLAGVASLLLFWRFCREVATSRTVLVAVAILAASFYPVRHANEVKPYAVDLLVSLCLTSAGWSVWRRPRSARRWLALTGLAVAGVWCSYPAVFPASGVALLLGLRTIRDRSPRLAAYWLGFGLLTAASWAGVVVTFAGPQAHAAAFLPTLETWRGAFPPLAQPWKIPWWLLDVHTGHMLAYPHGGHNFGSAATALLVVVGVVAVWRHRARRPLLLLLLGPLLPALLAAAWHRYPYGTAARVMLYMAPAICLLAAEGVVACLKASRWPTRGPFVVAAGLGLVPIAYTILDVAMPYTRRDDLEHRRLAHQLAARTAAGDRWIVFNGATPPPVVPDLMITRWVQRVAEVRFYLLASAPVPTLWEPDPATVPALAGGTTWFIVQRHGSVKEFPEARLAGYQRALDRNLGPVRSMTRYALADNESLTIFEYAASP